MGILSQMCDSKDTRPTLSVGERAILAADKEIERAILAAEEGGGGGGGETFGFRGLSANGQGRSENIKSTLLGD